MMMQIRQQDFRAVLLSSIKNSKQHRPRGGVDGLHPLFSMNFAPEKKCEKRLNQAKCRNIEHPRRCPGFERSEIRGR